MSWLATFGIGLLTAIIGIFGVGTLAALCVEWYRISGREGGSAYFVIFIGLLGGIFYLVAGMAAARFLSTGPSPHFFKILGIVAGAGVVLLLVATLICWLAADLDTTLGGNAVELHAEIRCPPGFVIPANASEEHWYAHIDTRSRRVTSRGPLRTKEARQEEGRWIIPMTLDLNTSVRQKLLYVRLAENVQLFIPEFPSKPGKQYSQWSDWQDGGWEPGKPRPDPVQRFNFRFRLQVVLPPASAAELETKKQVEETAAVAQLTPDSSLEDCLKFTHYSHAEDRRQIAGAVIARRVDVVAELSAEILSPDRENADRALRSLAYVKPLPAELAAPVKVVGDKIIADIEKLAALGPVDDPNRDEGPANISVRFAGWFEAQQALHDLAGVDGLALLKKILERSLEYQDSPAMNEVARIASYYVTKWSQAPVNSCREGNVGCEGTDT